MNGVGIRPFLEDLLCPKWKRKGIETRTIIVSWTEKIEISNIFFAFVFFFFFGWFHAPEPEENAKEPTRTAPEPRDWIGTGYWWCFDYLLHSIFIFIHHLPPPVLTFDIHNAGMHSFIFPFSSLSLIHHDMPRYLFSTQCTATHRNASQCTQSFPSPSDLLFFTRFPLSSTFLFMGVKWDLIAGDGEILQIHNS